MITLVVSNKWDTSADYVVKALRQRNAKYIRLNTEDLVRLRSTFSDSPHSYFVDGPDKLDLYNISSVLLRRPGKPFAFTPKDKRPSDTTISFVTDQWNAFMSGLQSLVDILWINYPQKSTLAESKIIQLRMSQQLGLHIPKTCITSSKDVLSKFWKECDGNVIAKALHTPLIREGHKEYFVFSNRIKDLSEIKTDELSLAPVIFQEEIEGKTDYRLTIIGNDNYCVKIKTRDRQVLDWRTMRDGISYEKVDLPKTVADKCTKLVQKFGLVFGAIDIVESKDKYYFLEINPNGEWGWLQKNANMPIAETLADYLSGAKTIG